MAAIGQQNPCCDHRLNPPCMARYLWHFFHRTPTAAVLYSIEIMTKPRSQMRWSFRSPS